VHGRDAERGQRIDGRAVGAMNIAVDLHSLLRLVE